VREFVFVDAHNGKIVEQITGKQKAMDRRLFSGYGVDAYPPASYPSTPFWVEGNPFPTGNPLADEIIRSEKETYDLYKNAFGRDSYDGRGRADEHFSSISIISETLSRPLSSMNPHRLIFHSRPTATIRSRMTS
jgi:hypothetical protein